MARFRQLDSNNDWTFGKGQNNFATGDSAIALNIKTRLQSWLRDCYFDQFAGIDWLNRLGNRGQQQLLERDVRVNIIQTQDVTGLEELSVSLVERSLQISYTVRTVNSQSFRNSVLLTV